MTKHCQKIFLKIKLIYLILIIFNLLKSIENTIIRIAHLQPNEKTKLHESQVLKMCANDLIKRAILPTNFNLE